MATRPRIPTVAARIALPLVLEWKRRGLDPESLAERVGVDEAGLRRLDARVSLERFADLHAACEQTTKDPAFAITALETLDHATFPPLLHLVGSQHTLREGVGFVSPFVGSMLDGLALELVLSGDASYARFRVDDAPLGPPAFAEYFLALLWTFVQRVAPGSPPPSRVTFAHRWPRHGDAITTFFDAKVELGAAHVGFDFRVPGLEVPIPTADPELGDVLARSATGWATGQTTSLRVRDRAKHFLAGHLTGEAPTTARVADALRMSERSLRRHLLAEGVSLRALVLEVRRERAIALLEAGRESLDAIAVELGYTSASAFGRAFRAWTGRTPTEYARAHAVTRA